MRVYLERPQTIDKGKGASIFHPQGFHLVDDELGCRWLGEGVAKLATEHNEVIEPEPAKEPVTVEVRSPEPMEESPNVSEPIEDETPAF